MLINQIEKITFDSSTSINKNILELNFPVRVDHILVNKLFCNFSTTQDFANGCRNNESKSTIYQKK